MEDKRKKIIKQDEAHWYEEIDWPGACAFVLACGLSFGLILGFTRWLIQGTPLTENGAQLLAGVGGAIVGTLATYLGRTTKDRPPRRMTTIEHVKGEEEEE